MKILIVCATLNEFNPGSLIEPVSGVISFSFPYSFRNLDITVLVTGAGMVNTVYHLQKQLIHTKFDLAINAGIAGCFKKETESGTVFHVVSDCFGDFGAEDDDLFIPAASLGLMENDLFPFQNGKLINQESHSLLTLKGLPAASSVTVNTVHGKDSSIRSVKEHFHPDLESMEGASFFYVCLLEKIPCIQLRAVSNYIEKRNRDAWNMPLAISNLEKTMILLLSEIADRRTI